MTSATGATALVTAGRGVEARLLAAMIADGPAITAATQDLASEDFALYVHREIFDAIRNVQASGEDPSVDGLIRQLEIEDRRRDACTVEHCVPTIALLLIDQWPYPDEPATRICVEHDVCWLKQLARRRRNELVLAEMQRPARRGRAA